MAKKILIKSKEGVEIYFALKEITLKGEAITKFPSGEEWSDGLSKPYVYGESYVDNLPDEIIEQMSGFLIPADSEEEDEPPADAQESAQTETSSEG